MRLRHFASLGMAALLSGASPATAPVASASASASATDIASASASSSSGIGFQVPTVVDPIHTNGEPDIAIDVQGRVFVSGPTGTGTQRSTWFGSVDGGQTFRVMAQKTPPDPIIGILAPGPGGGDTDINFDRSGKQYFADLYALTCLRVAVTGPTNSGATDQETGKVLQAAGCSAGLCGSEGLYLNIGTPDSTGTLHFLDAVAGGQDLSKLIKIADTNGSPDTLFSVLSIDSARNLVVVWCIDNDDWTKRQVFVSAASAASGWANWTTPVQVSDGSTATGDAVNVFPWIKAGGPGRADAVWYGSDKSVDPSSQSGQSWNVFMSQVVYPVDKSGALTGKAPAKTLVKVTPHPMHYNDICLQGSACITSQGNRNLADFFVVTIDKTGAAEIVYDDTSNGLIQKAGGLVPPPGFVDHSGAG